MDYKAEAFLNLKKKSKLKNSKRKESNDSKPATNYFEIFYNA